MIGLPPLAGALYCDIYKTPPSYYSNKSLVAKAVDSKVIVNNSMYPTFHGPCTVLDCIKEDTQVVHGP